jgi:phospholipid/cholesterol/gamma-HCH transport system substrate-binding protein
MQPPGSGATSAWAKLAASLRIPALVLFTVGCFGVLLFLWVAFGGPVPLQARHYELRVDFQGAATLAKQADVRIAGVNIGKVTDLQLDKGGAATRATLEIDPKYAPLPADTRAILRQKSLLGETYVELAPGTRTAPKLEDGQMLARSQVEPSVQLDQILAIFDKPTRQAFRAWLADQASITRGGAGKDLNSALGNLSGFATNGADILGVLDRQRQALRLLVRNTGVVFGALSERNGQLRSLIRNSHATFSATASERAALADTFAIFPTFLDESRLTLARLERFSRNTDPLVNDLKPVADDLAPTIRDVSALAPDLQAFFVNLHKVIPTAVRDLPDAQRFLRGASPVLAALHPFLQELNPILSYANFNQNILGGFFAGAAAFNVGLQGGTDPGVFNYALQQFGVINSTSLSVNQTRPAYDRGNAYVEPNYNARASQLGIQESWDCKVTGGTKRDPSPGSPPCFVKPPSLWNHRFFQMPQSGEAPNVPAPDPDSPVGTRPARP